MPKWQLFFIIVLALIIFSALVLFVPSLRANLGHPALSFVSTTCGFSLDKTTLPCGCEGYGFSLEQSSRIDGQSQAVQQQYCLGTCQKCRCPKPTSKCEGKE